MAIPKGVIKPTPDKIIIEAALATIKQGTKVFVVNGITKSGYCTCGKRIENCTTKKGKMQAGKHPLTGSGSPYPKNKDGVPSWTLASTDDPEKVKAILKNNPYNIAVHAGANDVIITDIDTPEGINWFAEAIEDHPEWFKTPIDFSGYKDDANTIRGIHVYHRQPAEHVNGFNTKYGEVRCNDQYAVISPSMHFTGVRYEPVKGHEFTMMPMQVMPPEFLAFLRSATNKEESSAAEMSANDEKFKKPIRELNRDEFIKFLDDLRIPTYERNALIDDSVDVGQRSEMLYWLEHRLARFCTYEQTCTLLHNCAFNKFQDRPERLRYEVYRAFVDEGVIQVKKPVSADEGFCRKPAPSCREFLLTEIPTEMWAIRKCLLRRSKTLIAGESKSGKSTMAYIAAASIAGNRPFLNHGQFEIMDTGPVMIIDGENSKRYIKRQLIQAYLALGILEPDQLENPYKVKPDTIDTTDIPNIYIYASDYGINFKDPEGMAFIEQEIMRIKPVIIIWDSFYTFFTGDVKEEKDVLPILNEFTTWRTKHNVGIAVVVHFNKGNGPTNAAKSVDINRISGTKVFGNWYETAWLVSNPFANVDDEPEMPQDDEEDDLSGEMTIVLRCLFREARKRISTVTLRMTSTSCSITVWKGKNDRAKSAEATAVDRKVKLTTEEMKKEVMRFLQAKPLDYARSYEALAMEMCDINPVLVKRNLRTVIKTMQELKELKVCAVKGGTVLSLLDKDRIAPGDQNDL